MSSLLLTKECLAGWIQKASYPFSAYSADQETFEMHFGIFFSVLIRAVCLCCLLFLV